MEELIVGWPSFEQMPLFAGPNLLLFYFGFFVPIRRLARHGAFDCGVEGGYPILKSTVVNRWCIFYIFIGLVLLVGNFLTLPLHVELCLLCVAVFGHNDARMAHRIYSVYLSPLAKMCDSFFTNPVVVKKRKICNENTEGDDDDDEGGDCSNNNANTTDYSADEDDTVAFTGSNSGDSIVCGIPPTDAVVIDDDDEDNELAKQYMPPLENTAFVFGRKKIHRRPSVAHD